MAEETARVSAATEINNSLGGNIGYNVMGTSLGPNMATHFSSIFKPISNTEETNNNNHTRGLSLWMGQGQASHDQTMMSNGNLHEIHQSGGIYGGNNGNPLVQCSNSNPYNQLNWVFGNKLPSICSNQQQEINTTNNTTSHAPLGNNNNNIVVKDATTNVTASQTIPSLYSSQHQTHHQTTSSANMSATALLQKAAQIGATTSTDPSFLGSLGLKCSNNDGNKFGGGMYGSSSLLISLGSEEENSVCDFSQMPPPSKRRHVQNEENGGGQTRDFLGVGVQTICHPSSINGWI